MMALKHIYNQYLSSSELIVKSKSIFLEKSNTGISCVSFLHIRVSPFVRVRSHLRGRRHIHVDTWARSRMHARAAQYHFTQYYFSYSRNDIRPICWLYCRQNSSLLIGLAYYLISHLSIHPCVCVLFFFFIALIFPNHFPLPQFPRRGSRLSKQVMWSNMKIGRHNNAF